MVSREEKRRVKKSPNYAMCWSVNWSTPEILAANKGRCEPGGVASRLTKRMAFSRFSKLYKNETGRRDSFADLTYHEAKQVASDYQVCCSFICRHGTRYLHSIHVPYFSFVIVLLLFRKRKMISWTFSWNLSLVLG